MPKITRTITRNGGKRGDEVTVIEADGITMKVCIDALQEVLDALDNHDKEKLG